MRAILYIIAPIPLGFFVLIVLSLIGGIWSDSWPDFAWHVLVSLGLVLFLYGSYRCWRIAFEDVMSRYK